MIKYKFLIISLLAIIPLTSLYSKDSLDKYLSKYRNLNTFQAKFEQRKHLSMMTEDQISHGYIKFKKANKLIWALEKPYVYRLVLNNKKVIKVYPQLDEREEYNIDDNQQMKAIFDNIYLIMGLKNKADIEKTYQIEIQKGRVILTPKSTEFKKYVSQIILQFTKDYLIQSIKLIEPSGDYTVIRFSHFKLNKAIEDSEFKVN